MASEPEFRASEPGGAGAGERPEPEPGGAGAGERPEPEPGGAGAGERPEPEPGGAGAGERPEPEPGGAGAGERPEPEPGGAGAGERPEPEPGGAGAGERPEPEPEPGGAGAGERPEPEPGGAGAGERPEPGGAGAGERPEPEPGGAGAGERPEPEPGGAGAGERPEPGQAVRAVCGQSELESESRTGDQTSRSEEGDGSRCQGAAESLLSVSGSRRGDGGEVLVLFPGQVTPESCCRLVCELLKHVLYQRQQLPLPYEQLSFFSRRERGPADSSVLSRSRRNEQSNCKMIQRALMELDEVFQNLAAMFMLTLVPCVHILLGGSVVNPKEMYEINMERLAFGSTEESLKTISCIRKLFHTLFVEDLFNELKSIPLMNTLLLVQGHRDCGIQWFRPKLNYRVPNRTRKLVISLACDGMSFSSAEEQTTSYNHDYIWFQAPITIKGFH
ncbi:MAD2L1-binding protein [Heptranchias perlo]|uniref:MAD2L1-binding protein n=1 Tax=Heptranchias perlo TaxID=212740 RepID=UPI003559D697